MEMFTGPPSTIVPAPPARTHHLLRINFPATELLPPGKSPFLEKPPNISYREEPKLGTYHLTDSTLDFFARFAAHTTDSVPPPPDNESDISVHVSRLATAPGVSDSHFVSCFIDDDVVTRCRLRTTWITSRGKSEQEERYFELDSLEWQLHLLYADSNPHGDWITLLHDLMTGASDRAVLHRRQNLEAYNRDFADRQDAVWDVFWDDMSFQTPNQLLANHLKHMYADVDGGKIYAPMLILHHHGDEDVIDARLPCRHRIVVRTGILGLLPKEQCVGFCCEIDSCQKRVMDKQDDDLLVLAAERERRNRWAFDQILWESLDGEVRDDQTTVTISEEELYWSLLLSLESLQAPSSATADLLDPVQFPETESILHHFQQNLKSRDRHIARTPQAAFVELQHQAVNAVKNASAFSDLDLLTLLLPPDFENFLHKWLTRATNFAMGRTAAERPGANTHTHTRTKAVGAELEGVMERLGRVGLDV